MVFAQGKFQNIKSKILTWTQPERFVPSRDKEVESLWKCEVKGGINMTSQGIAYLNFQEGHRHNVATETQAMNELGETHRHNVVYETETGRHNRATEQETSKHNRYEEATNRMNAKTNQGNLKVNRGNLKVRGKELKETRRHNKATEKLTDKDRQEKTRHNKAAEQISQRFNQGQLRLGDQKLATQVLGIKVGAQTAAADRAATTKNVQYTADSKAKTAYDDRVARGYHLDQDRNARGYHKDLDRYYDWIKSNRDIRNKKYGTDLNYWANMMKAIGSIVPG
jgi:hypothetical protein